MPQLSQHQAAELWELTRDHSIQSSKLRMMEPMIGDGQLRSTISRHADEFRRIADRLLQFFNEPGTQGGFSENQGFGGFAGTVHDGGFAQPANRQPSMAIDAVIAGACLSECKSLAIKCIRGATEASQPLRNFLYELAGTHLRMADECYHWIDQKGLYAEPKVEYNAVQQYTQKLNQFESMGRQVQQPNMPVMQPVHAGPGPMQNWQPQQTDFGFHRQ